MEWDKSELQTDLSEVHLRLHPIPFLLQKVGGK
nr:MAG TPA: hypothetical protein [Bacteriophage sp.]